MPDPAPSNLPPDPSGVFADFDNGEPALTPADVRKLPECGGRVDVSTVFRWFGRGLLARDGSRVRLESVRRGGQTVTTRSAARRFFAALSGPAAAPVARTPAAARRSLARAERLLQEAGI